MYLTQRRPRNVADGALRAQRYTPAGIVPSIRGEPWSTTKWVLPHTPCAATRRCSVLSRWIASTLILMEIQPLGVLLAEKRSQKRVFPSYHPDGPALQDRRCLSHWLFLALTVWFCVRQVDDDLLQRLVLKGKCLWMPDTWGSSPLGAATIVNPAWTGHWARLRLLLQCDLCHWAQIQPLPQYGQPLGPHSCGRLAGVSKHGACPPLLSRYGGNLLNTWDGLSYAWWVIAGLPSDTWT